MKKIVLIIIVCVLMLIVFVGCGEVIPKGSIDSNGENPIGFSYAIAYAESGSDGESIYGNSHFSGVSLEGNCIALIRSEKELIEFSDEKELSFFEIKGDDYYHIKQRVYESELSQKIRSYDESFFTEKSLVLVFVEFPNMYPAKIDTVTIEKEELVVKVARPETESFLDALSYHAFVIEVEKRSVENKSVKLTIVRKGSEDDYLTEIKGIGKAY